MKPENKELKRKLNIKEIINETGRLIIAGPCSAESREQVIETAMTLSFDSRVSFFRAGLWKPRTTAGSFQGVGKTGLKWLQEVKIITGMPVATEVGSAQHVYEALKHGVDLLWVGARTVGNPFAVQEIASALRGIDIPILVKNPLSADINLWEGAINRFARAGISQLAAVHRGFSTEATNIFRNQPNWAIPKMLRQRMPDLPIINDPSHLAGKKELVSLVAQRAIESGLNGLMVEVHPNPEMALSDAMQQIKPEEFIILLDKIFHKDSQMLPEDLLTELRIEIDMLDDELISVLGKRMELIKNVALIKKQNQMGILQTKRWNKIRERIQFLSEENGLNPSFVKKLFTSIHRESCSFQETSLLKK